MSSATSTAASPNLPPSLAPTLNPTPTHPLHKPALAGPWPLLPFLRLSRSSPSSCLITATPTFLLFAARASLASLRPLGVTGAGFAEVAEVSSLISASTTVRFAPTGMDCATLCVSPRRGMVTFAGREGLNVEAGNEEEG
jgi:hypothetical protein